MRRGFYALCIAYGVQRFAWEFYWKAQKDWLKPADRPLGVQTRTDHGCPHDCGGLFALGRVMRRPWSEPKPPPSVPPPG